MRKLKERMEKDEGINVMTMTASQKKVELDGEDLYVSIIYWFDTTNGFEERRKKGLDIWINDCQPAVASAAATSTAASTVVAEQTSSSTTS